MEQRERWRGVRLAQTVVICALMSELANGVVTMETDVLRSRLDGLLPVLEQAAVRLCDPADAQALHDVRVALRKARTLLRPWRSHPAVAGLLEALRSLAQQTGRPRDDEVLATELKRLGFPALAAGRQEAVSRARHALAGSTGLAVVLALWPEGMAVLQDDPAIVPRQAGVRPARRAVRRLLADPAADLHELRLPIKRLRYRLQVERDAAPHLLALLRLMQALLGQWHDLDLWLQRAEGEPDLSPCVGEWTHQRVLRERQLLPLREALERALA